MKIEINDWKNDCKKKLQVSLKILRDESQGKILCGQPHWNVQELSKILGICRRAVFGSLLSFPNKILLEYLTYVSVYLNDTRIIDSAFVKDLFRKKGGYTFAWRMIEIAFWLPVL